MSHQNVQVRINALMRQNTDIINFLKSQGALLSTVRAEFLLSEDDFQVWLKARLVKLQSDSSTLAFHPEFLDYHRKLGQHFHCISREAWINILLQVAKIYVFDQIDATSFRTSPGMDSKEELQFYEEAVRSRQLLKEATVAQSASEGYLLRWLSYSSFRHTGKWQLAADFRSELANGRLIANTILAHIPDGNAVVDLKRIKEKESSAQEWEAAIRNALGDIFVSTIDEFVLGDENLRHGFKQNSVSFGMFSLSSQYGRAFGG